MVPSHRKVRSGRDEFRETLTVRADGNPEPSRRYTAGRCRDYLSAGVALNDRLELPAPLWGEEIVHSLRKRRGRSESLGPRFESERAHQPIIHRRVGMSPGVRWCTSIVIENNALHAIRVRWWQGMSIDRTASSGA